MDFSHRAEKYKYRQKEIGEKDENVLRNACGFGKVKLEAVECLQALN